MIPRPTTQVASCPDIPLAELPGLDEQTVAQTVEPRPLRSAEDLGSALELPAGVGEEPHPVAVFIR